MQNKERKKETTTKLPLNAKQWQCLNNFSILHDLACLFLLHVCPDGGEIEMDPFENMNEMCSLIGSISI